MQMLLQSHPPCKISIALLHSLPPPRLRPYPALPITIPNIIRLRVETAVPGKCAPVSAAAWILMKAGGEAVGGGQGARKHCASPSLDQLLGFKNPSGCKAYEFLYWYCWGAAVSNFQHLSTPSTCWSLTCSVAWTPSLS